jgi:exodeoxyribonuclease VIII
MELHETPEQELHLHGNVDLTNEQYHAAPGLSKSMLDAIAVSPLAFWDAYVNPEREPREEKHCFAVGSGTHTLVLEPHMFEQTYAVGFDKTAHPDALDLVADLKKACTERGLMVSGTKGELVDRLIEDGFDPKRLMPWLLREHAKTMGNRIPIAAQDYKNMLGMLNAISRHHTAPGLIQGARVEQSYFVTLSARQILGAGYSDDEMVTLKARPDLITANGMIVPDLKTTDDVSEDGFGRTIEKRRYDVQAAICLDILYWLYGADAPRYFAFIAAQKFRPYDVAVHWLDDDDIARGRALYRQDLALYLECRRTNSWPGADGGKIIKAKLPSWARNVEPIYL